jgi:cytochrome P450
MKTLLTSFEFSQSPYPLYNYYNNIDPLFYIEEDKCWLATGYDIISKILQTPELFSSVGSRQFDPILLNCDPPKHTHHRKLMSAEGGVFSYSRIKQLESNNTHLVDELLNNIKTNQLIDVLNEVALPFSSLAILNLLGIGAESSAQIQAWTKNVVSTATLTSSTSEEQFSALQPLINEWVNNAYLNPGSRGLAEIIYNKVEPGYFTKENMAHLLRILLIGGNETTPNLISSAIYLMLTENGVLNAIRDDERLIENLILETLRLEAPTQLIARTINDDTAFENYKFKKGQLIYLALGAGNRDKNVFINPDIFDLNRNKTRILSFGYGPHYCLGVHLAMQETRVFLSKLISRFTTIQLAENFKPVYRHTMHVRGMEKLPLLLS